MFFTKCWKNIELHLQWHRVTSHKTCIFNNTVVRTQSLATYELLICSLTQSVCLGWLIILSHFKMWLKSVPLRTEVCAKISKGAVMWNPPSDVSKQACEGEWSCIWKVYVDGGHARIVFSVDKPVFLTCWLLWGINLDHLSGNSNKLFLCYMKVSVTISTRYIKKNSAFVECLLFQCCCPAVISSHTHSRMRVIGLCLWIRKKFFIPCTVY